MKFPNDLKKFSKENLFTPSIENHLQSYAYLVIMSMVYMSIMLCNAVLTNRYVGSDTIFVLGGTLTSPFIFILDSMIAEVYGYKIARTVILAGFASQIFFTLICQAVVFSPSPSFFHGGAAYTNILGISFIRITFSGFAAYVIANLLNCYVISQWKVLLKGRHFWMRSLGSSVFAEGIYSVLAIFIMQFSMIPLEEIFKVIGLSYLIKIVYGIIFAGPSHLLINYIKVKTGIDEYDLPKRFIPFDYVYSTVSRTND